MTSDSRPPAAPAAAAALDAGAIVRLRELDPDGRHAVVARVLSTFDTSLRRILAQLEAQRGTADAAVVAAIAHTLKSSSASVGALGLAAACADIEARLRAGDAGALAADVERLLAEGRAALQAVAAMLRP